MTKYRDLAAKCWSVGNDLRLRGDIDGRDTVAEGIEWLGRGEGIVEIMDMKSISVPEIKDLKVGFLSLVP